MRLRKRIKKLENITSCRYSELYDEINTIKRQLECASKTGHEFEYADHDVAETWEGEYFDRYFFRCKCGVKIAKRENELTPTERKALISLGIITENKKGELRCQKKK